MSYVFNSKNYIKKVQRKVNSLVAEYNKSLIKDELWLGRFYVRQLRRDVYKFEDGSGAVVSFLFELGDKKTGIRDLCRFDNYELHVNEGDSAATGWKLGEAINDFIIKEVQVWKEEPRPSLRYACDYTKVAPLPLENLNVLKQKLRYL